MSRSSPLALFALLAACASEAPVADAPVAAPTPPPVAPAPAAPAAAGGVATIALTSELGDVVVTPTYHATTMIQVGSTVIWLDPWSKAQLDGAPKADVLLISDVHFDHLDLDAIKKVIKPETIIVAPQAAADKLGQPVQHVLANGASVALAGITITAVPMYNLVRGPEEGGVFHEKGRGNGYLLAIGGRTLYFAGDTECTDEMRALRGVDLAFVPMNLPYTMTPEEAAACVLAFAPATAVPYHYAGSDLTAFQSALAGKVPVTLAEFYPGGAPW